MIIKYKSPELSELEIRYENGFASSVTGGIDDVSEETGTWD